jgi:hypothetical protein
MLKYFVIYTKNIFVKPCIWFNKEKAEEQFIITKRHDKIKTDYCKEKGIKLIRIADKDKSRIREIVFEEIIKKLI